jgi:hypothetical protein
MMMGISWGLKNHTVIVLLNSSNKGSQGFARHFLGPWGITKEHPKQI